MLGNPLLCRAFAFRHSSVYASASDYQNNEFHGR
ncbi:pyrroline-5-carboxylate reductase, partial [Escherichia coli]